MSGTQDATFIQQDFCKKDDGNYGGTWSAGNYCFLNNNDDTCVAGKFNFVFLSCAAAFAAQWLEGPVGLR